MEKKKSSLLFISHHLPGVAGQKVQDCFKPKKKKKKNLFIDVFERNFNLHTYQPRFDKNRSPLTLLPPASPSTSQYTPWFAETLTGKLRW